jgi:hypothetical protein
MQPPQKKNATHPKPEKQKKMEFAGDFAMNLGLESRPRH